MKSKKLKELARIKVGLHLLRKKAKTYDENKFEYDIITLKDFSSKGFLKKCEMNKYISIEKLSQNYLTKEGDVLIRLREPSFAVYINKDNSGLLFSSLMAVIKPSKDIDGKYLTSIINSNLIQKRLQKKSKGTTISMITVKDLLELEILVLPLKKQVELISAVELSNKEIELLESLIKLKKELKEGLLNNILLGENKNENN